jgi:hypothetical protein
MNKNNITDGFLTNANNKVNCYLLGFLWADGWIYEKGYSHRVSMALTKTDFDKIESLFTMNGIKTIYEKQKYRRGKKFGKSQKCVTIQSKEIVSFLIDHDYEMKSFVSPLKILDKIPENLKCYFWRGYIDGDGCISSKRHKRELAIWSTIEQDWSSVIHLFKKLGVTDYQIYKYRRKKGKHKSSVIRIGVTKNIKKVCEYIYQNYDGMGLSRKYVSYQNLLKLIPTLKLTNTSKYKGVCFNKLNGKWKSQWYDHLIKKDHHVGWFDTEIEAYEARENYMRTTIEFQR